MKIEGHELVLSTGTRVPVFRGVIGLGPNLRPSHGYDGHLDTDLLTRAECIEIADYMIDAWQRFRESGPTTSG